jgi:hypothetical protein
MPFLPSSVKSACAAGEASMGLSRSTDVDSGTPAAPPAADPLLTTLVPPRPGGFPVLEEATERGDATPDKTGDSAFMFADKCSGICGRNTQV